MSSSYPITEELNLTGVARDILQDWKEKKTFEASLQKGRQGDIVHFYEGPPGANGKPGIHHWFCRVFKDLFCRYKTMQGYTVPRKSGWDAHGLPVELAVEKELGITKEDIGNKVSIEDYNEHCKTAVMRYKKAWEDMTEQLGYWLDLDNPYTTSHPAYISQLWKVLQTLYKKGYLYKGHSIQPFSPAAGTGISTHELNQPGCYKEVQDTSIVAQFKMVGQDSYLLAWTTTPWTLPANSGLAVDPVLTYVKVKTFNRYTSKEVCVILAESAVSRYFDAKQEGAAQVAPATPNAPLPWKIVEKFPGKELVGHHYEQLLPYVKPKKEAFRIIAGDFVNTKDGTGIVHLAPTFGADDQRVARQEGLPAITVTDAAGEDVPIVDRQGRFVADITDFARAYVKKAYDPADTPEKKSVDILIAIKLKKENKAFLVASYLHSYPHCWRTDKPILYYPLHAWFIKTTACKERLVALNKEINWQPPATGSGRFGEWLQNLVDWNITRDRFWGTPLPIWRTKDGREEKCIGSIQELREEVAKAVKAGHMAHALPDDFNPHRPYVDDVVLVSSSGEKMYRESDVIDVWFDSGAMPYAQHQRPADVDTPPSDFPADFIVEGVDQTRGWFYTLHVIAGLLHNSVAFKNVLATGLVLDKEGRKMSKRLGNAIDSTALLAKYGPDVIRWYMVVNTNPWENLKFDVGGLDEVKRKFFGTLFNTYKFFALYANLDQFEQREVTLPTLEHATESDRWILSRLQQLIRKTKSSYDAFSPTQAARALQGFVIDDLSNWYVRLNRKRFWQEGHQEDKHVAYQTLHCCLATVAKLAAPIAPFYMDQLYRDLLGGREQTSVHLADFPVANDHYVDEALEESMHYAQTISSLVHALRKKHNIKVRQPLAKISLPISDARQKEILKPVLPLVRSEVNVKDIAWIEGRLDMVKKRVRPNFPQLKKRYAALLREIGKALQDLTQEEIYTMEAVGEHTLKLTDQAIELTLDDVLISTEEMPGTAVAQQGIITVALDLQLTPSLRQEGIAREFVHQGQQMRKKKGFAVEDKVVLRVATTSQALRSALEAHQDYIMQEVQASRWLWEDAAKISPDNTIAFDKEVLGLLIEK